MPTVDRLDASEQAWSRSSVRDTADRNVGDQTVQSKHRRSWERGEVTRRVLIVGSSGFIGRHLLRALRTTDSFAVSTLNRKKKSRNASGADVVVEWEAGAIQDAILAVEPDIIVHLAEARSRCFAIAGVLGSMEQNVVPAVAIVEAASRCRPRPRIIYLDTGLSYGDNPRPYSEWMEPRPMNGYALSKHYVVSLLQMAARTTQVDHTVLKVSVVYGPEQSADMLIPSLIVNLLRGIPFEMTSGDQTRDFLFVEDLVRAIILAASSDSCCNEILNVASGQSWSIRQVARLVAHAVGKSEELLLFGRKSRPAHEPTDYRFDISKIRRILGWVPTVGLEEGVLQTVDWFMKRAS
jgi:nucleoside-diphosphate-sugar epimerase